LNAGEAPEVLLLQLAETLDKRSRLATEIIKGVILPQFVILPLAVLLVWFALARGIQPLDANCNRRIRRRESTDLSPIAERDVPEEVAPWCAPSTTCWCDWTSPCKVSDTFWRMPPTS
jgi:two-component system sensor histidine kinase TctE